MWRRIVGLAVGASLILPGFYLLGLWEGNIIIAVWLFAFGAGVLCDEFADWPRAFPIEPDIRPPATYRTVSARPATSRSPSPVKRP